MHKKATASQRLFAFLIDAIILLIVIFFLNLIIKQFILIPVMPQVLYDYLFENSEVYDPHALEILLSNPIVTDYYYKMLGIIFVYGIFIIILFIGYFVILASLWKYQTVGRLVVKIKVITQNNTSLMAAIFLREIVGVLIISIFGLCCCCIPGLINLILIISSSNTTIHDKIANTLMVMSEDFEEHQMIFEDQSLLKIAEKEEVIVHLNDSE